MRALVSLRRTVAHSPSMPPKKRKNDADHGGKGKKPKKSTKKEKARPKQQQKAGKGQKKAAEAAKAASKADPLVEWPTLTIPPEAVPFELDLAEYKSFMRRPPPYRHINANLYRDPALRPPKEAREWTTCDCAAGSGCGDNCLNRQLYLECEKGNCKAAADGQSCGNCAVQGREFPESKIVWTPACGWGLKVMEPVKRWRPIAEYCGEVPFSFLLCLSFRCRQSRGSRTVSPVLLHDWTCLLSTAWPLCLLSFGPAVSLSLFHHRHHRPPFLLRSSISRLARSASVVDPRARTFTMLLWTGP